MLSMTVALAADPATRPASPASAAAEGPATRPASASSKVPTPAVADKSDLPALPALPKSAADLKAIEARVSDITRKVMPAVVGIQAGGGQGSGVIITRDGYVLTAGHVSGNPGTEVTLTLADGRRVKGKSLGLNKKIDSGLIKITDEGDYPVAEIGKSGDLVKGQWVIALGHPGGYRRDRPPVLRLGKVLISNGVNDFVMTDCTLIGGDSGGPLFDLEGRIVGIHSRIGPSTLNNMHTPVDTYIQTWDRLAAGESWGDVLAFMNRRGPILGIQGESLPGDEGAVVREVSPGGPAEKAGLKAGDVIRNFGGKPVRSMEELAQLIGQKRVDEEVAITVDRDGKAVELKARLASQRSLR
jgi:serine protease Do